MYIYHNNWRGKGLKLPANIPAPSVDAAAVAALICRSPKHRVTPLIDAQAIANKANISSVSVKDERTRMGLGSFKALGAAYVIAHLAHETNAPDISSALNGEVFVTASAGNHGMSVAAGAKLFGAQAVIYLSKTVPEGFAQRLAAKGARVVVEGDDYEASMRAAQNAATTKGWTLLSDSSWDGYTALPHRLMEGYLQLAAEAFEQISQPPSHIFLQAGVGGLAGSVAALARVIYGNTPKIIVVEPDAAPALLASIQAGAPSIGHGPVSCMGRLDCKEPSLIALKGLSNDADYFTTISEQEATDAMEPLIASGLATTPSGGAGLAALLALTPEQAREIALTPTSHALFILSEEP